MVLDQHEHDFYLGSKLNLSIISNDQKGLIEAENDVLPKCEHKLCD